MQRLFVIDKSKSLIGRQTEVDVLKQFALYGSESSLQTTGLCSTLTFLLNDNRLIEDSS